MITYGKIENTNNIEKIIIVGGGKSLEGFKFGMLNRSDCYVITVNDVGKIITFSDAWFTVDPWGLYGPQLPGKYFTGKLFAAVDPDFGTDNAKVRNHRIMPTVDITYLRRLTYVRGLSEDPSTVYTGNSGFGAFGMAYHLRPKKILLLGIDCGLGYFYTNNKVNRRLDHVPKLFAESVPQLKKNNIEVINGSPNSKITCFPRYTPDYAFKEFLK